MSASSGEQVFRSLARLRRSGASARVWDVAARTLKVREDDPEAGAPFHSPLLNKCLILKHRLRANERALFKDPPTTGTKLILPFAFNNLSLGGRSIFVGEQRWLDALADLAPEPQHFKRDAELLEAVAELPSLDPFLLREHLRRRGFDLPPGYLDISQGDQQQMLSYCMGEIGQLLSMAFGAAAAESSSRASELLLAGDIASQLDPLRRTLQLDDACYGEGMFCWRGFLYYKWVLSSTWPRLKEVVAELGQLTTSGPTREFQDELRLQRERLLKSIGRQVDDVRQVLQVYDDAYATMVEKQDPGPFRDFLLRSPALFPKLGELTGGVMHIASYWRYRFPAQKPRRVAPDELLDILIDFDLSLAYEGEAEEAELEARVA